MSCARIENAGWTSPRQSFPVRRALIRRGETGDLSTLCEGFLQPPPSAFCTTSQSDPRTDFGPCLPVACRIDILEGRRTLFFATIIAQLSSSKTFRDASYQDCCTQRHAVCNNSLLTTTGEHSLGHSPDASVSREGFAILEWTVLAHFPLAQAN
jgi:hypothetical protein